MWLELDDLLKTLANLRKQAAPVPSQQMSGSDALLASLSPQRPSPPGREPADAEGASPYRTPSRRAEDSDRRKSAYF